MPTSYCGPQLFESNIMVPLHYMLTQLCGSSSGLVHVIDAELRQPTHGIGISQVTVSQLVGKTPAEITVRPEQIDFMFHGSGGSNFLRIRKKK